MTHTLVTLLGRVAKEEGGAYRTATYRFPDGSREETSFFGLALANHLRPDRLVVLGTHSSMWGTLVEHAAAQGEEEDARLELFAAEDASGVGQALLDRLSGVLRRGAGREVVPKLIPFGRTDAEQRGILETIGAAVPSGAVSFDLTHAFRHLAMVGMLSAFMLERIGRLAVRSLWYGAFDMTEQGVTPVLQLDGLNAIERWIAALDRFDATGDYGVFAPLLEADGVPADKVRCLEEAAFYERVFNLSDAAPKLQTFRAALQAPLPGASGLFQNRLAERLKWIERQDLAARQRELAEQYMARADFVRASVFAWEALVSRECKGYDLHRRATREAAEKSLDERFKSEHDSRGADAYRTIRYLRNALAHGTPPENESVRALLRSPERLRDALQEAIRCLFDEPQACRAR
jgi:CRISPR-associated Csx2 family protein